MNFFLRGCFDQGVKIPSSRKSDQVENKSHYYAEQSPYFQGTRPQTSSHNLQETNVHCVAVHTCRMIYPDRADVVVSIITPPSLSYLTSFLSLHPSLHQATTGQPREAQANPQAAPSHFPRLYLANASHKPRQLQVPINSHASPLEWQLESFPTRRHHRKQA